MSNRSTAAQRYLERPAVAMTLELISRPPNKLRPEGGASVDEIRKARDIKPAATVRGDVSNIHRIGKVPVDSLHSDKRGLVYRAGLRGRARKRG